MLSNINTELDPHYNWYNYHTYILINKYNINKIIK